MKKKLIFATRPSALARWQTNYVIHQLKTKWREIEFETQVITTKGDQVLDKPLPEIGGKGLFTFELERALLDGRVDAAVHSLKDLPIEDSPGLVVGVIPERADPRDVLVSRRNRTLEQLPAGAVIGTSSLRRQAQILAARPDLKVKPVRGNVGTRIDKVLEGQYDAAVLAAAGVIRLGLESHISEFLPLELMLPAPGQGALAVQCRAGDVEVLNILSVIDHPVTNLAVKTERAFLTGLGGGCSLPIAAHALVNGEGITLSTFVGSPSGKKGLRLSRKGTDGQKLGSDLAQEVISQGVQSWFHLTPSPLRV